MLILDLVYTSLAAFKKNFDPTKQLFFPFSNFSIFGIIYSLQNTKSANIKHYCHLKFQCWIISSQHVIIRLGNVLKICLVFRKSEPHYAHKRYAYK